MIKTCHWCTVACSETNNISQWALIWKWVLEMGWKFLKMSGSRRMFLISGVKIASLRFPCIVLLDVRDRSIILVIMSKSTSMHCLSTHVDMGSTSHDLVAECLTSFSPSSSLRGFEVWHITASVLWSLVYNAFYSCCCSILTHILITEEVCKQICKFVKGKNEINAQVQSCD